MRLDVALVKTIIELFRPLLAQLAVARVNPLR
jgi:hypothetical protein